MRLSSGYPTIRDVEHASSRDDLMYGTDGVSQMTGQGDDRGDDALS